jgi:MFS family permease
MASAYIYLAFVFATSGAYFARFPADGCSYRRGGVIVTIPLAGHLSDHFGRKRIYLVDLVLTGIFGFIYFAMLNTAALGWIFLAIVPSFVPHDLMWVRRRPLSRNASPRGCATVVPRLAFSLPR